MSIAVGEAAEQRFRSGVDLVTVDALVTEGGRAVTGLKAEDFRLRDNGVLQEVDSVTVDEAPISMLLALDTSNSVEGPTLGHLKQAAATAGHALSPSDRAAVMTFAESVKLRADWSAPTAATRTAIATAESGGATSLYDASYAALTLQDGMPGRRSYILLFSDGGDTSSWLPASALLERARRSDAVVYVVTRRTPRPDVRPRTVPGLNCGRRRRLGRRPRARRWWNSRRLPVVTCSWCSAPTSSAPRSQPWSRNSAAGIS